MSTRLPDALESIGEIESRLTGREPVVFLDFDGTLAPIVEHPDEAAISEQMRSTLERLAGVCRVAVVSGRDLSDVRRRVGLGGLAYAGSHGFDIRTAEGERVRPTRADEFLPVLDRVETRLRDALGDVEGAAVERKRYSVALHYRRVAPEDVSRVEAPVEETLEDFDELRLTHGKKVLDLQPDLDWDKGEAIDVLLETLDLPDSRAAPIYLGDDVTDEDAFRRIGGRGISIAVDRGDRETAAEYELRSPAEARRFLERLAELLEGSSVES